MQAGVYFAHFRSYFKITKLRAVSAQSGQTPQSMPLPIHFYCDFQRYLKISRVKRRFHGDLSREVLPAKRVFKKKNWTIRLVQTALFILKIKYDEHLGRKSREKMITIPLTKNRQAC